MAKDTKSISCTACGLLATPSAESAPTVHQSAKEYVWSYASGEPVSAAAAAASPAPEAMP